MAGVGNYNSGFRFDVQSAVCDHATGSGNQNADDEKERLSLRISLCKNQYYT